MAVDVVGTRSRRKRASDQAARKAKREKVLLGVFGVILLLLVGIEGPKTLKKLHGSPATTAPAPAPAVVSGGGASGAAAVSAHAAAKLSAVKALPAKDPFIQQLGAGASVLPAAPAPPTPPAVRSHFVVKDPFVQQLTLTPTATTPAATSSSSPNTSGGNGSPAPAAGKGANYIVVLASVPLSQGRADALHEAAAARAQGVAKVKIVDSSDYPTLRTGYYAVYSGPYPTLDVLQPALEQIRGQGYPGSYSRRLAH
jgi:eukaryotic-like serine/threonine-protein kinase